MKVTVKITKSFTTAAKPLLKKYPSLPRDLSGLEKDLIVNPKLGTALGQNIYKIRSSPLLVLSERYVLLLHQHS